MANFYELELTEQFVLPAYMPLITAATTNESVSFKQLLGNLDDVNVAIDNLGNTVLHAVVYLGKREFVQWVLAKGADPQILNHRNQNPLHFAPRPERVFLINTLLDNAATGTVPTILSAADELGNTPLHVAASEGDVLIVRALLDHGAPLLLVNNDGKTPYEVAEHNSDVGKLLLKNGSKLATGNIIQELKETILKRAEP